MTSKNKIADSTPPIPDPLPKTSRAELETLLRRAGLSLKSAEMDSVLVGWGYAEAMLLRLRTPALPREAEPALIFRPDSFGGTGA